MLRDVTSAVYKGDYTIELTFDDGARGNVDFSEYTQRGGVFERLKDVDAFREFTVNTELGTLTWNDEVDIAPETLYALATGKPLPPWMDTARSEA